MGLDISQLVFLKATFLVLLGSTPPDKSLDPPSHPVVLDFYIECICQTLTPFVYHIIPFVFIVLIPDNGRKIKKVFDW